MLQPHLPPDVLVSCCPHLLLQISLFQAPTAPAFGYVSICRKSALDSNPVRHSNWVQHRPHTKLVPIPHLELSSVLPLPYFSSPLLVSCCPHLLPQISFPDCVLWWSSSSSAANLYSVTRERITDLQGCLYLWLAHLTYSGHFDVAIRARGWGSGELSPVTGFPLALVHDGNCSAVLELHGVRWGLTPLYIASSTP